MPTMTTYLTRDHIALGEKRPGATSGYVTEKAALACGCTNRDDAEEGLAELRGNGRPDRMLRTFHLKAKERPWHVTARASSSLA